MKKKGISRREFILRGATAATLFSIVPASVFGKNAPSNRINVGMIGAGRISRTHDMPGVWNTDIGQIVAVCDLDSKRVQEGKTLVNDFYTKKNGKPYDGVKTYTDHRELLLSKDIDAVVISTPDHQHARIAVHAARAKKDIYLQKPTSLTIAEGRMMADEITKSKRIFQIGSQQRSWLQFRYAAELVRNGRIGKLHTVQVGLPRRSFRRGRTGDAHSFESQLRCMARFDTTSLLYRETSASAARLRQARMASL